MKSHSKAPHAATNTRSGFTRTDLLTLVVAISLWCALQLPMAGTNRSSSKTATCLDNFRRLALAMQLYAADNAGFLPPNPDDGNAEQGSNWVAGNSGPGGRQEFDSTLLTNPPTSLLATYLQRDPTVFRCPADNRSGTNASAANPDLRTVRFPAARSVSLNGAVGTNPYFGRNGKVPADGPWLDGAHGHSYGRTWYTYGRESQLLQPGPARTVTFIDEDALSINDGHFGFSMATTEWIDFPATWHDGAGTLAFADAHVEIHHWDDARTITDGAVSRRQVPGSPDYYWLRERISAAIAH